MNILVTGANGFIGHNLVQLLSDNVENNIIVLVRKRSNFIKIKNSNIKIIESDICNSNLNKLVDINIDVIIHLASVGQDYKNNNLITKTNVKGIENLINCFKSVKQFIFSSTSIINFENDYAKSKLACENIIKKSDLNYTILRIGPIFGINNSGGISKIIKSIKDNKKIPIPGNGKFWIQPIFIDDVTNGIKSTLLNEECFHKTLNLVGNSIYLEDFIKKVCKILEREVKLIHIPFFMIKSFARLYPEISVEQIKVLKYKSDLNPDFQLSMFEESVKKSI